MEDDQYLDEMLNKIIITKSQLEANEYIRLVKNYIYVTNKYTNLKKVDYLLLIDKIALSRDYRFNTIYY